MFLNLCNWFIGALELYVIFFLLNFPIIFSFTPKDCEVLSTCIDDFTNTLSYQFEKTSVPSSAKKIKEINTVLDWGSPMAIELIESNFNKEVVTNLNKDEQEAWISVLSTAYKILERYTPKLFNEIFNGLSIIIPVHSKENFYLH